MENAYKNEQVDSIFEQVLSERESLLIDLSDDPTIESDQTTESEENEN